MDDIRPPSPQPLPKAMKYDVQATRYKIRDTRYEKRKSTLARRAVEVGGIVDLWIYPFIDLFIYIFVGVGDRHSCVEWGLHQLESKRHGKAKAILTMRMSIYEVSFELERQLNILTRVERPVRCVTADQVEDVVRQASSYPSPPFLSCRTAPAAPPMRRSDP